MDIKNTIKNHISWKVLDELKEIRSYPATRRMDKIYSEYCSTVNILEQKNKIEKKALEYVKNLQVENARYRFSEDAPQESLYASVFACLVKGLFDAISEAEQQEWLDYFNQCQRKEDGLFDDGIINDTLYYTDKRGYGARHLAGVIINAYDRLGGIPPYEFQYLNEYKEPDSMIHWLSNLDYRRIWGSSNEIMNVGTVMQFARDRMGMPFDDALEAMEDFLLKKIRKEYGLWYEGNIDSKTGMYEAIRGAYHIFPVLWYDNIEIPYADRCLELLYRSQNAWGGFDNLIGSGACEDIDAIDPLLRLSIQEKKDTQELKEILERAERWILFNQNTDGGFVFDRKGRFDWGKQESLSSASQHSNIFATWFRILSLQLIDNYRNQNNEHRIWTPSYECPLFQKREIK
ncbi:MAG: hypothetical protein ACI4GW_03280 [Lachnospiraceae bacterium]